MTKQQQTSNLLTIEHLSIQYHAKGRTLHAVRDVSFTLQPSEVVGIVGESGCGKSTLAHAILQLLPPQASIPSGAILVNRTSRTPSNAATTIQPSTTPQPFPEGVDNLAQLPETALQAIRGKEIAMIFQDPFTSLNPVFTVGAQIAEVFLEHEKCTKQVAWERAVAMLAQVKIPEAARRAHAYPHELSGGMRQRAMIAMALALRPKLLIADEPTTALDVTTQIEILNLMRELQQSLHMAVLFISHDLNVIATICDQVLVMYAGEIVEAATTANLFKNPTHPYTQGLLAALPNADAGFPKGIPGRPPFLHEIPTGCAYEPRCPLRVAACQTTHPLLEPKQAKNPSRCLAILADNISPDPTPPQDTASAGASS